MAVAAVNEVRDVEQRLILLREPALRKRNATPRGLCGHAVLSVKWQQAMNAARSRRGGPSKMTTGAQTQETHSVPDQLMPWMDQRTTGRHWSRRI